MAREACIDLLAGNMCEALSTIVEGRHPTVFRSGSQSLAMTTKETGVRRLEVGITRYKGRDRVKVSVKLSLTGNLSLAWAKKDSLQHPEFFSDTEHSNELSKGYSQSLRLDADVTHVNVGTLCRIPNGIGARHRMLHRGRSLRSSPRLGKPTTWRREAVR